MPEQSRLDVAVESELRRSEARYRSLVAATAQVVWATTADGEVVEDLPTWRAFTGQSFEQHKGRGWMAAVHPDDIDRVGRIWAHSLATKSPHEQEFRVRRHDGVYRHVLARAVPIIDDASGEVREWVGTCTDITEKRNWEIELQRSEERFRLMADHAPVLIWMADTENRGTWYNKPWLDFTGRTLEQEMGYGWVESVHPDDRAPAAAHCSAAFARREPFTMEFRLRRRDRQYRWMLDNAVPLYGPGGEFKGYIGSCIDITEQRAAQEALRQAVQQAERASEAKSAFLATLSHELRTPLTPVLLTASLMQSHPDLPADLREDVATIRRNVELESQLISDLLDLTRIEKGKLQLDMQEVDLHLILRSAIDICQREASARLTVDLRATRHTVRGDSTRLQQIFWNLINNAIKFSGHGGSVTVRSSDAGQQMVRVDVIDTGIGINPSILPRLFNAFEQGDVRGGRQHAGLGLGLAISRKLAEAHGGTISASSAGRGKGATFSVELPAAAARTPATSSPRRPAQPQPLTLSVLLVEDHDPTLVVLTKLLRGLGHRVTGTSTVASAVAAANQQKYDLIISDLGLPDGSGLDLLRQLRQQYGGSAIALTGYGMESDVAATRDAGFAEHLIKPVDADELRAAIQRVASPPHTRCGDRPPESEVGVRT